MTQLVHLGVWYVDPDTYVEFTHCVNCDAYLEARTYDAFDQCCQHCGKFASKRETKARVYHLPCTICGALRPNGQGNNYYNLCPKCQVIGTSLHRLTHPEDDDLPF